MIVFFRTENENEKEEMIGFTGFCVVYSART